jgi:hypothetical protein
VLGLPIAPPLQVTRSRFPQKHWNSISGISMSPSQHGFATSFTPWNLSSATPASPIFFGPFIRGTCVGAHHYPSHRMLLHFSSLAFGALMESYCNKACGSILVTTHLHILSIFFHSSLPPNQIWRDNFSGGQHR